MRRLGEKFDGNDVNDFDDDDNDQDEDYSYDDDDDRVCYVWDLKLAAVGGDELFSAGP